MRYHIVRFSVINTLFDNDNAIPNEVAGPSFFDFLFFILSVPMAITSSLPSACICDALRNLAPFVQFKKRE